MAKVQNTFLKSKMNKDLDARLLPQGEYRDARNAQISKSESNQVGNLENSLGNKSISDYTALTGESNIFCIGSFADELNSVVFLFFTSYTDPFPSQYTYEPTAKNFIISTNILSGISTVLVKGAFLNFSQTNLITGVNILENLLFFTDNRNQPRVINTILANTDSKNTNPTYYSTEDQISVAKYNPFEAIELWQKSILGVTDSVPYETTMKDVSSLFLPNGGSALSATIGTLTSNVIPVDNIIGEINSGTSSPYGAAGASTVFIQNNLSGGDFTLTDTGQTVDSVASAAGVGSFDITLSGSITIQENQKLVFNANPYFDSTFGGDPDYLDDKFVRFSYRYRFEDNEYSIFAPFTQIAFIPKQDGYFMFVDGETTSGTKGSKVKNDQDETYRSSVVYFVENKLNSISLKIPLPYYNYDIQKALKIKEIDILYKESDGIAVRSIETVTIDKIKSQSGVALTNGAQTPGASGNNIAIDNLNGGIVIGSPISGAGIDAGTTILSFTPTDPSNPFSGNITVSTTVNQLDDNVLLTIGDINYFIYEYESTKPTKTLPEDNLIRVFDKIPVRAQAQEVAGNRVIYGNFQNKIDPPPFLNYNVAATVKSDFLLNQVTIGYTGTGDTIKVGSQLAVNIQSIQGEGLFPGYVISCNAYGATIPPNTQIVTTSSNSTGAANLTFNNNITLPSGSAVTVIIIAEPGSGTENSVTKIEYPSSSVKTNRNYQIGFVLADRYGRQSGVILSNNETSIIVNGIEYAGSTLYAPYINPGVNQTSWPGNSLKVLVNSPIPNNNLYNGDVTDEEYNPLGWYSYKIVVKQTEQEYYNVYLPGIMASYPNDTTLEVGQTSHTVLINDNINKVPRDLTEVGPEQKQFRSSVQLIGRVQNLAPSSAVTSGNINTQFYPRTNTDTVSVISTVNDLFDYNPVEPPLPNLFPQFYSLESNPLVARLSTVSQIGQLANANYGPVSGESIENSAAGSFAPPSSTIILSAVAGTVTTGSLNGFLVSGVGIPAATYVASHTLVGAGGNTPPVAGLMNVTLENASNNPVVVELTPGTVINMVPTTGVAPFELTRPGLQYLAVSETEPIESIIDIFWETSTSGLISDLNSAILNNQSEVGGTNITWNTSPFTEGLAENGYILAGNGFQITDSFGQTIQITASDSVEFSAPNDAFPVTNGFGESVISETKDYFRLIDLGTNSSGYGPWQIQTTSQTTPQSLGGPVSSAVNYFDNIYYFENENEDLRQFTFTIKVTIGGQENFITKTANLANVLPQFFKIEALNVNSATSTYGPGGTIDPPPNFIPVQTTKTTQDIANIDIDNGSANKTDPNPNGGRALSVRDVNIVGSDFQAGFIFDQRIGSPTGPVAQVDGNDIFTLNELTPTFNGEKEYRLINNYSDPESTSLIGSTLYYVTLAVQDSGGFPAYQRFEIDMRVQLNNSNFWNKNQRIDAFQIYTNSAGGNQWQGQSEWDICGNNCQPTQSGGGQDTHWWYVPGTTFQVKTTDIGAAATQTGWYIYGYGYFDNTNANAQFCCLDSDSGGVTGSFSMVEYSAGTPNTITIPMNTPITPGNHLVQKQPTVADGFTAATVNEIENVWGLPPKIHGRIAVTAYSGAPDYLWTYEILEGDSTTDPATTGSPGATGTAITSCMKLFRDVNGTRTTLGNGWNWNNGAITKATMEDRVLRGEPGQRIPRIKYTTQSINGDLKFYYNPLDGQGVFGGGKGLQYGGIARLDENWDFQGGANPQIIYTYYGPFNSFASPWYFSPSSNDNSIEALKKVWSMYHYSPFCFPSWRYNENRWRTWAQSWEVNPTSGEPTPFNQGAINNGLIEFMQQTPDANCDSRDAQLGQDWRPTNAGNFSYAII